MKLKNQNIQNLIKINLINHQIYKINLKKSKNNIFEILKTIFGIKNKCYRKSRLQSLVAQAAFSFYKLFKMFN